MRGRPVACRTACGWPTRRRWFWSAQSIRRFVKRTGHDAFAPSCAGGRGYRIGLPRIERLIGENGIGARRRRRYKATTNARQIVPLVANVLSRHDTFRPTRPIVREEATSPTSPPPRVDCICPS